MLVGVHWYVVEWVWFLFAKSHQSLYELWLWIGICLDMTQSHSWVEWPWLASAKWNFLSMEHQSVLLSLLMSRTFTLSMTRASIHGPHLGNGSATSRSYFWKTGSQNIPPLSIFKMNMSRSCRLGFKTAGCLRTQRTDLDLRQGWSPWWSSCKWTNKRFALSWIIMSAIRMSAHIWPMQTFVCTNWGSAGGRGQMSRCWTCNSLLTNTHWKVYSGHFRLWKSRGADTALSQHGSEHHDSNYECS